MGSRSSCSFVHIFPNLTIQPVNAASRGGRSTPAPASSHTLMAVCPAWVLSQPSESVCVCTTHKTLGGASAQSVCATHEALGGASAQALSRHSVTVA